jgi:hypothetical protein
VTNINYAPEGVKQTALIILPILATLAGAVLLGSRASLPVLALPLAAMGLIFLLRQPVYALFAIIVAALLIPREFSTGTEVFINPVTLLMPALMAFALLVMVRRGKIVLTPSAVNRPLFLFLMAGLLSFGIGAVTWDVNVPRSSTFWLTQAAQWAIFAFSAGAFWLTAYLAQEEVWLKRLTFFFLIVGGVLALLVVWQGVGFVTGRFSTVATWRATFWVLLFALAGGQLLFNRELKQGWRLFLVAILIAAVIHSFGSHDERASDWVGLAAVGGILFWLRFPRMGWVGSAVVIMLLAAGVLLPLIYEFAGGDERWFMTGGSRVALIERTIEVTMRNPITGLGPAAYRPYTATSPLIYAHIIWFEPRVSSHNNYVDIFSHTGLLGLGFFLWFMATVGHLGWRLRRRFTQGFAGGYVNGMLGAWVGSLCIMLLLDWFLPFVYNVGFSGFQASVLVWLFLGGLVSLEAIAAREDREEKIDQPA